MALYPIRDKWLSRPGWSEFGDWRVHGPHRGLDMYTKRGASIWAHGPGRVVRKGYNPVAFGHYVVVQYDDGYEVIYAHMASASPYAIGARVSDATQLGQVGDTGNAQGIVWNGLIHLHVEVRRGGRYGQLVNPRSYFGPLALAGGGDVIVIDPVKIARTRRKKAMLWLG